MTCPGIEPGFTPWEGVVLTAWPTGRVPNRGDKIRTCDLCVPNAALYQTEPRLDTLLSSVSLLSIPLIGEKCKHYFSFLKNFLRLFQFLWETGPWRRKCAWKVSLKREGPADYSAGQVWKSVFFKACCLATRYRIQEKCEKSLCFLWEKCER